MVTEKDGASEYLITRAAAEQAHDLARRVEGLELDPVYTAKAAAALLALRERGAFAAGPVLYWHTYGAPRA
jgi:D-cysteine desulfhydrase